MIEVIARLVSTSPYSQSKHYDVPKLPKELFKDYEERTWRERIHYNEDGYVIIPPMVFKNCLSEAAKFLSIKIPVKGNSTYTKHFEAGVMAMDAVILPIKKDDVPGEKFFVPSDGRRGGTTRVEKCFPVIHRWEADVRFYVMDETITFDIFAKHISEAGKFIGIGRFRPSKNGFYGRFALKQLNWGGEILEIADDEIAA